MNLRRWRDRRGNHHHVGSRSGQVVDFQLQQPLATACRQRCGIGCSGFGGIVAGQIDITAQFLAFGVQTAGRDAVQRFPRLSQLAGGQLHPRQPQPGNILDLIQFGAGDHPFQPLHRGRRIAAVHRQLGQPQCRQRRVRRFREVGQDRLTLLPGQIGIGLFRDS